MGARPRQLSVRTKPEGHLRTIAAGRTASERIADDAGAGPLGGGFAVAA